MCLPEGELAPSGESICSYITDDLSLVTHFNAIFSK